ncbi:MAG: TetR/AcrR family transcriptional regulator [Kineosporiaceae bacterium]
MMRENARFLEVPMPRAYLAAAERRALVLDATAALVADRGFHATSVDDICRAAGLSAGGLYRHFRSKREIVVALVARDAEETARRLGDAVAAAASPEEAVAALVRVQLAPLQDRTVAVVRAEIVAEAARDPEVARAATEHDDGISAVVRGALAAAAAPGSVAATAPEAAVELLATVVDGIAARCAMHGRWEVDWADLAAGVAHSLVAPGGAA